MRQQRRNSCSQGASSSKSFFLLPLPPPPFPRPLPPPVIRHLHRARQRAKFSVYVHLLPAVADSLTEVKDCCCHCAGCFPSAPADSLSTLSTLGGWPRGSHQLASLFSGFRLGLANGDAGRSGHQRRGRSEYLSPWLPPCQVTMGSGSAQATPSMQRPALGSGGHSIHLPLRPHGWFIFPLSLARGCCVIFCWFPSVLSTPSLNSPPVT